ncbi:hypothetical protein DDB_G0269904 [Dictyostelium discoideum AX4]|uniref:Uncharacterized protein n=1 Tax=Dictyostelium discoideum TaxID=44689 RepID=Q55CU1_DICDI|nr:hypothetical protein DDB_G0269904 [Dictyostelium discoideum AX4]EAL72302.1 hypothetical protein DDB_G0269904 [Dictyostelium discoideum AX4]|eukprot:XP_646390.1 hypothetical protein DDB_G0269904 [Dictyostelium discoideum AX4]
MLYKSIASMGSVKSTQTNKSMSNFKVSANQGTSQSDDRSQLLGLSLNLGSLLDLYVNI